MSDQIDRVLGGLGLASAPTNTQPNTESIDSVLDALGVKAPQVEKPSMAPLQSAQDPAQEQGRLIGRDEIVQRDERGLRIETPSASDELARLERERDALPSRDVGQFVGDNINEAASSFVGLVGTVVSTGISLTGKGAEYLGDEGGLLDSFGEAAGEYAVDYAQTANQVTEFMRSGKSDLGQARDASHAASSMIESQENLAAYEEAIANGEDPFIASLMWIGNEGMTSGSRILSDPSQLTSVVSGALGSLGPSAKVAGAASRLATNLAARAGVQEGRTLAAAEIIGSALGTGVIEGTGTYAQTVNEVMSRTTEEMMSSPMFRELIDQGMDPLEAQKQVADSTGMDAFEINLPMAIAAGVISSKFNANPAGAFTGKGIVQGLAEVGQQTLEEASQGGASQIATNMAIQSKVDNTQHLAEGIGEQLALGAIGGAGMSGVIGAPATIKTTIDEIEAGVQADRDNARFVRGMGEQIAEQRRADARRNMTPEERDAELREGFRPTPAEDLFSSVVQKAGDVAQSVRDAAGSVTVPEGVSGAVDTLKAGVKAVREAAGPVVSQVIKAAQNYTEKSNPVIQNETVAAADTVVAAVNDPDVDTGSLGTPDVSTKKESLPEIFRDSVPEGGSLADTMSGIVKTLAENKTPISEMKDDAVLFVAQKFNEMQNAASSLSADVQANIKKVLASPDLERIRKRAARLDLNTAVSGAVQKVSSTVKSMTLAMSKVNPTNVNPDVVDKILLKQEDREDLTPEDIQDMEIAASVSRPMNQLIKNIVQIENDKNVQLTSTGQKADTEENSFEKVSRKLVEGDPTNQEKLPSVKKSVNQIILGMRSANKTVDVDGVQVPVKSVIERFKNLTRHMVNKVDALNVSFDGNDEKGVGPSVNFPALSSKTGKFIPVGQAGSGNVVYNKRSIKSVTFAKVVGADATMMVEVHNALAKAYPEEFPEGPIALPVLKTIEAPQNKQESVPAVEDQSASETASVSTENTNNTTADEEASTPEAVEANESDEREATKEERAVIIAALEAAYPGYKIPNLILKVKTFKEDINGFRQGGEMYNGIMTLSPSVMSRIMEKQTERTLHILRHEFGHWADFSGEYAYSDRRDWEAAVAEFDLFVDTRANEAQKKFLAYILSYRESKTHKYPAEVFAELMGIMGVRSKFVEENMPTAFRIINEALAEHLDPLSNTPAVEEASTEADENDGPISDGTGKPLVFYHGTRNQFEKFNGNEIFLTTQRGFAKGYAFDPNTKVVGRLIAANVTMKNPLVVTLPGKGDTDVYWLGNALKVKEAMKAGNHDGILIKNEEGDAMVIATDDSQITQIEDPIKDRVPGTKIDDTTSERFKKVFRYKKTAPKIENVEAALDAISTKPGTKVYGDFARILLPRIAAAMNQRLQTVLVSKADGRSLAQGLKEDQASILEIRDFKSLMIVDPVTGTYDQRLMDLASMAVIDWMTTARAYGGDRLDDLLEELELDWDNLSEQQVSDLLNSVPPRSTTEGLARKIIKMWNVQVNSDSEMVDIRGTTEGLVKEIITVLSQMENPLIEIIEIQTGKGKATSFNISALAPEQEAIGMNGAGSLDKVFFPEDQIQASFGEKLTHVPSSQNNKSDVKLSTMERAAVKNMQDTAHLPAVPVISFYKALGLDAWSRMAGKKDSSKLSARHPLRLSIEGKNSSIERDFTTAFQMVDAAQGRPVYYPVGVTNVGRHQMKGINPQNNKLLRGMITPTHSKLDMANNQKHKNAFWLTVAQSSGLAKVEKKNHKEILSTIQEKFEATFGEATKLVEDFYINDSLNAEAFADAMLKANKGEEVSAAQINAVLAVARLRVAAEVDGLENFETTLSFELDGKTDGPANMMVALGQGIMSRLEYMNFKRVGLFLGSKGETLNSLFSSGEVDLYEVNSTLSTKKMFDMINAAKGLDKKRLMALQRFAAHFGDFAIDSTTGEISMTRATSKNPMTKKVYKSGEKGIADGISQDMLVGFYTKLTNLPDGVTVEDNLNYPEINSDLDLLFGVTLPAKLDVNSFVLPTAKMPPFAEYVKKTIGTILNESIDEVMGEKTSGVTDLLVYITGVQGEFMRLYFEQRIAEIVEEGRKEWEAAGKPGKFALRKVTQAAYDAVVQETLVFAPLYNDGLQTLRIGDFTGQQDKTEMSSNLNGNIRAKSTMAKPDVLGVKVVPYLIQGRGDAMMMNRIFGAENAPTRAIPIFDGIDMAITDFGDLSDQINEAVLSNWDQDVLTPVLDNFDFFLAQIVEQGLEDKLLRAFATVKEASDKKSSVVALDVEDLRTKLAEAARLNQARKAVFKQITLAVDHMGGSGKAYVRNVDGKDLSFEEINQMIQDQMDGKTSPNEPVISETPPVSEEEENTLVVTDVATVVDAVIRETKKAHLRDAIRAIRGMLPDDAQIVMGTPEQISKWRDDNLDNGPTDKLNQSTKGYYDVGNNIIFLMSDNAETIVHEMIHMATFNTVLAHYKGETKSVAVKNLEVLMAEFMAMDFTGAPKKAQQAANATKAQILKGQANPTPMGQAVALNEFMAWTLSNESLMKELKATPTSLVARLTKVAKAWIQRILGVVPLDMYSNILFNTEMVQNTEIPDDFLEDDNTPPPVDPTGETTPPADNFTNFWIDLLRERLEQSKIATGKEKQEQLLRYIATADDAVVKLDFGGFSLSDYQKKTFTAIHAVIASELRLDSNALIAMGKVYEHITNNLTPAMFGTGQAAQDRYSAVMELMGATKNDEGISDSIAVLMALSQTSKAFRLAMDQIPTPPRGPGVSATSLNDLLTTTTGFLMQKMISTTDTEGKGVKDILDGLSDQILRQDDANEFRALKTLMGTFDKADKFVGGALSLLAQRTRAANIEFQKTHTNGLLKTVAGSITIATAFLDKDLSKQAAKGAKAATHMDGILNGAVFIREMVAEVVGADSVNIDTIQMLDKVNYVVQSTRQAFREELPVILQNEFKTHPTASMWKALHNVLGKGDFAALFDLKNPDESFDLLNDQALLDQRIKETEKKILREFPGQTGANILLKSQQLADYMNGKGAGFQLWKNAYAIHKLVGGKKPSQVATIDRLVSLYALNGTDVTQREDVARMQAEDPDGVHNLLVYVQALNKEEDQKIVSEAARMNGYKGYIPDIGKGEVSLIIARDADRENLEKRGYVRVADDNTDSASLISRGYYMSTTKQAGNYSQGVLQQVQDTYRGVNAVTGLTVNGTVSGVISGVAVLGITDALNQSLSVADPKHVLIPVMDEDGGVLYYERAINPDLREKYLQPESNMALMTGAWAGRQVEEKFSHEYNKALVTKLKSIWDNREPGTDGLFIRMDTETKDKIYAESWSVIPPQLKEHIIEVFGEADGFMVRKDMINLALGYRDPSITDVWTGNHRLPEAVALAIKVAGKATMGDKAFSWLANTESLTMNTVSTAKDLIVVRSLVVPLMNTQSNVFQLVNRGVGTKKIMKGYREKFAEIDKLNANLKKIMGLQARIRLKGADKNQVAILKQQIQVLEDENNRFTVAPLVKEGAYKNISEGITELDVSITDGKFGDWFEGQLNKLPAGVQTVAKYGLLSKDTALYKGANKAVQYGDFVAKSIYYDHLMESGLTHEAAMGKVNEEFINFSLLPGRMRTGLEAVGATWFLTFKIRSMKIALQMMRENPVRSLAMVSGLGIDSGPITDNVLGKFAEGTLPYSLGWDMLWDAPGMNPWIELTNG